ncbi:acidic proline-rich protein PRP25-like [Harmonia axyridis]|uniref:acidic proline-rich protein PRP25-like n=1 Tax=Harmonia axyridis TaxID=115357 RepID=UPI001E279011|nr:acidic proline-rich protein PRP25-like [Harmonia axyridis]
MKLLVNQFLVKKMCTYTTVLFVFIFLQVARSENPVSNRLFKRSPQQIDIQSIRQKQITPEITVVDVVVNEPGRRGYPNQNQYIQQPGRYPGQGNYYPNNQYQNVPNRRQPEIQIIEVVDPRQVPGNNQQWQIYPQNGQIYPNNNGRRPETYPGSGQNYPNRQDYRPRPNNGNRWNRRPYRPNSDFHIPPDDTDEDFPPRPPPRRGPPRGPPGQRDPPGPRDPPGQRGKRPKPPRPGQDESSEEEQYIFDNGEGTVTGYTKDNFPIIPLHKNDIRR